MTIPIEMMSPFAQIADVYCPNVSKYLIGSNHSSKLFFTNTYLFFISLFLTSLCICALKLIAQFSMTTARRRKTHL